MLIGDNSKFVKTEESPEVPTKGATKSVRDKYERWQKANNKAWYYMLTSMVDTLKKNTETVNTKKYANGRMAPSPNVHDQLNYGLT